MFVLQWPSLFHLTQWLVAITASTPPFLIGAGISCYRLKVRLLMSLTFLVLVPWISQLGFAYYYGSVKHSLFTSIVASIWRIFCAWTYGAMLPTQV